MRRSTIIGLLVSTALVATPAARASDESVRAVTQAQAERQQREDARFERAVRNLDTRAQLRRARTATRRQRASIETFKRALAAERADTAGVAEGRRELIDALNLYDRGLNKFHTALTQAIEPGGSDGEAKARSALRNIRTAVRRAERAARKIRG